MSGRRDKQRRKQAGQQGRKGGGAAVAVCDFCAGRPVVAYYGCRDLELQGEKDGRTVSLPQFLQTTLRGPWAACRACETLIDANDRVGLSAWAMESGIRRGLPVSGEGAEFVHLLHQAFWENRTGEVKRLSERPPQRLDPEPKGWRWEDFPPGPGRLFPQEQREELLSELLPALWPVMERAAAGEIRPQEADQISALVAYTVLTNICGYAFWPHGGVVRQVYERSDPTRAAMMEFQPRYWVVAQHATPEGERVEVVDVWAALCADPSWKERGFPEPPEPVAYRWEWWDVLQQAYVVYDTTNEDTQAIREQARDVAWIKREVFPIADRVMGALGRQRAA